MGSNQMIDISNKYIYNAIKYQVISKSYTRKIAVGLILVYNEPKPKRDLEIRFQHNAN